MNGHKDWTHWNVALWMMKDEGLHTLAMNCIDATKNKTEAAKMFLRFAPSNKTPDGAEYTVRNVRTTMMNM